MTPAIPHKSILLTGLGITSVAVMCWSLSSPPDTHTLAQHDASFSPAAPDSAQCAPVRWVDVAGAHGQECSFEVGQTLAYEINVRDELTWRASVILPGASSRDDEVRAQIRTRARLVASVLEVSPERALMRGRLIDVTSSRTQHDAQLERPFLFHIDTACQIEGFAHHDHTPPAYARMQQSLLHELMWRLPQGSGERFDSSDELGTYAASLSAFEHDKALRITRQTHDISAWEANEHAFDSVERAALRVFRGPQTAWFDHATMQATLIGEGLRLERAMSARSVEPRADRRVEDPVALDRYVWADLLPSRFTLDEPPTPTREELLARAEARKLTVDQALDTYVERVQAGEGMNQTWPILKTYLEARPEQAQAVVDKLYQAQVPAEATMGVYLALGQARTPEAREALEGVMRDEQVPVFDRSRAMFALGGRADVGLELAHYMSQTARQLDSPHKPDRFLAGQSLLALGFMGDQQDDDDETLRQVTGTINQALSQTLPHDRARSAAFGAVANLGDPTLLPQIQHNTHHEDWRIRRDLAVVTRRMPPLQSAAFTAAWLDQETNPMVRTRIYQVLELQTYDAQATTSEAVLRHALADLETRPDLGMRLALVSLLGHALEFGEQDDLGIARALAAELPFELEMRSGLYDIIAKQLDPHLVRAVLADYRRAQAQARARGQELDVRLWRPDGAFDALDRNGGVR